MNGDPIHDLLLPLATGPGAIADGMMPYLVGGAVGLAIGIGLGMVLIRALLRRGKRRGSGSGES